MPLQLPPSPPLYATSLKVLRRNNINHNHSEANGNGTATNNPNLRRTPPVVQQILQIRRRRDGALGSAKPHAPDDRRNTIADIAQAASEWQRALDAGANALVDAESRLRRAEDQQCNVGLTTARSTDCLQKREFIATSDRSNDGAAKASYYCSNNIALPSTNAAPMNISTLPRLRVRRPRPASMLAPPLSAAINPAARNEIAAAAAGGPEFILNSSLAPRELTIVASAGGKCVTTEHLRHVSVLLLNGRTLRIGCNALRTTAGDIFVAALRAEAFAENFFLGLCALIGGDFVFLPHAVRVCKVAPQIWREPHIGETAIFTLFMRVRFFVPDLRGIGRVLFFGREFCPAVFVKG